MTAMPPFTGDAVFHAQQVAEKTLKAFLVWHGRIFRKTHNLFNATSPEGILDLHLASSKLRDVPVEVRRP